MHTEKNSYTLPNLRDFTANLHGKIIFTTLDLCKVYLQVPMSKCSKLKTAIVTSFGMSMFLRMPFGVMNARSTFQRLLDEVLAGLPYVFCYLDDILIASSCLQEHEENVRTVLQRLRQAGLSINPKKCQWFQLEVSYLGHKVNSSGIFPLQRNADAIKQFTAPNDKQSLLKFLGLINFYRPFIPAAADTIRPLTAMTSPKVKFQWSADCEAAFLLIKDKLAAASALSHPDPTAPLRLTSDASDVAAGASLDQLTNGVWTPLGFFSTHFNPAQVRYSTFDRELTSLFLAVRYWRHMLDGNKFQARTDHKHSCPADGRLYGDC